jgi:hypothetical protein
MDQMQKELIAEYPNVGIVILGVNETGYGNNEAMYEGVDLPWLQDTEADNWWGTWGVTLRDVVILDRDGEGAGVLNVTEHDLANSDEYDSLKKMLIDVAGQE